MNWRLVYQEIAFAEYTIEDVAKRHGLSVEELAQIEELTAPEALAKGAHEAAGRAASELAKQEVERRAVIEASKRAAGEKAKQRALAEGVNAWGAGAAGRRLHARRAACAVGGQ